MCSVKGHTAIAVLVGEIAVRMCREREEKSRSEWLKTHVVDEIIAGCQKHTLRPYGEGDDEARQTTV